MTQRAAELLGETLEQVDLGFTPNEYLMRDYLRIIAEKPEEARYGVSFGAERFCHIHDRADELAMYAQYYQKTYPNAFFFFWNGETWKRMERILFFSKLYSLFHP